MECEKEADKKRNQQKAMHHYTDRNFNLRSNSEHLEQAELMLF